MELGEVGLCRSAILGANGDENGALGNIPYGCITGGIDGLSMPPIGPTAIIAPTIYADAGNVKSRAIGGTVGRSAHWCAVTCGYL